MDRVNKVMNRSRLRTLWLTKPRGRQRLSVLQTAGRWREEIQNQIQQGLYVKNGAAYSVYYFSQSAADTYTQALNHAAKELEGQADVYSILVPNNSGAMLPGG